ncbi:G-protein coupled receptor [Trichinella spiralis]
MSDPHLPVEERLVDFRLLLYLYQYSQMWLNLFTVMNSSLPFYCYLAFNPIFRQEAQRTAVAYCWRLVALVKRRGMSSRTPRTMSTWKNESI